MWVHRQGKFDLFELPVWISLNIYIQVVLNVSLFQRDLKLTSPWLINNASAMAVKAIFLFGFSLTVFWSAYIWVSERLQRHSHIIQTKAYEPRKTIIIGIWVITWLITTLSVVLGVQGYLPSITSFAWTNYLKIISLLGDLVTFILLLYHFRHPTLIGRCWLVFVCSTSVFLGLVVGTKGAIFIFLYLVMALYYAQNRIPKAWLSVGLLILFIIVPVVNTFRSSLFAAGYNRSTGANFSERLLVLSDSTNQVITQPISMLAGQTGETFKARQGSIMEITMAMLAVHPSHRPYIGSDILLELETTSSQEFSGQANPHLVRKYI